MPEGQTDYNPDLVGAHEGIVVDLEAKITRPVKTSVKKCGVMCLVEIDLDSKFSIFTFKFLYFEL